MGLTSGLLDRLLGAIAGASPREQAQATRSVSNCLDYTVGALQCPVKTAVIPAAGSLCRVLSASVMQKILIRTISEAVCVGIQKIVLVLAPGASESLYEPLNQAVQLSIVPPITLLCVEQPDPMGLGDAVLQTRSQVSNQIFAVLLPDDIVEYPVGRHFERELRRMIQVHQELGAGHILAVTRVLKSKMARCGIVRIQQDGARHIVGAKVTQLTEKPAPEDPICMQENVLGIVGRYLLDPSIFSALAELKDGGRRPIELTDAIELQRKVGILVYALAIHAKRTDVGGAVSEAGTLLKIN